jgi:hypothetical protein
MLSDFGNRTLPSSIIPAGRGAAQPRTIELTTCRLSGLERIDAPVLKMQQ